MSVNKTVFASKSERENYQKLCRTWGATYPIYHNLPFLNVFDLDNLMSTDLDDPGQPLKVLDEERNRLKKTSIDYTLCDKNDMPMLCIEFDGMQQGSNVGPTYYAGKLLPSKSVWRRHITELKLRVALGSGFPFFVVGSKYFNDLLPHLRLTIVDGIIGDVVAWRAANTKFGKGFDPEEVGFTASEFDTLPKSAQHEIAQDWVTGVEVEESLTHNPIAKRAAFLEWQLHASITKKELHPLNYPSFNHIDDLPDRIRAYKAVILTGARVVYHTETLGVIETVVWLPNFEVIAYTPLSLAEEIASLLALERIARRLSRAR